MGSHKGAKLGQAVLRTPGVDLVQGKTTYRGGDPAKGKGEY